MSEGAAERSLSTMPDSNRCQLLFFLAAPWPVALAALQAVIEPHVCIVPLGVLKVPERACGG